MPLLSVSDSASTTNAIGGLKVHPPEGASGPQSQARPRSQRSNISTVDTYGNQHRGGQGSANNDDLSYPMDNNPFRQFLASVECDTDAAEPDDFDYTALTQADAAIGYKVRLNKHLINSCSLSNFSSFCVCLRISCLPRFSMGYCLYTQKCYASCPLGTSPKAIIPAKIHYLPAIQLLLRADAQVKQ